MQLTAHQVRQHTALAEAQFLSWLQAELMEAEPAFLPRFDARVRPRIVHNLVRRARHLGATWQSSITLWALLMAGMAPNLHTDPAVRAWLASTGGSIDAHIKGLPANLGEADWQRISRHRQDWLLFVPPQADAWPLVQRVALALPLVLWDHVPEARAAELAAAAVAAAHKLGFAGLDDAPVAVAAWRFLYGASFADPVRGWPQDIRDPAEAPAIRLEMLRTRIMMDHGRWA